MKENEEGYLVFTGYSDDIVSISGNITEQHYPPYEEDAVYVTNTGTVIKAEYNSNGIWVFDVLQTGAVDRYVHHSVGNELTDKQYTQGLEIFSDNVITDVIQLSVTDIEVEE